MHMNSGDGSLAYSGWFLPHRGVELKSSQSHIMFLMYLTKLLK